MDILYALVQQLTGSNTNAEIQATYNNSRVLNQGGLTLTGGGGGTRIGKIVGGASGRCADVAAANSANGTQVQLYSCDANGGAQAWTIGTDGTIRALGRCLDVAGGVNANGTKVQVWDCTAGNLH